MVCDCMSEDSSFIEFEGNKAVARLNELDLSKSIGGSNVYYNLRIERTSEKEITMAVWNGENSVTAYEVCKIEDVARKLINKRTPLIMDIIDIFGGEELPPTIAKRLRITARVIQQKWLNTPLNEDVEVVDSEHLIDEEQMTAHQEKIMEEAEKALTADNPALEIKKHLDNIIAGEDNNKILVFVLGLTGKCEDPKKKVIVIAIHESGAGKSWILKNIAALYNSHTVSHLTKNVLKYLGPTLADKELLFIKELGNMDQESDTSGNANIKMLSVDDGGLTTTYTIRDKEGKFETLTVNTKPITIFTSTTRTKLDEQFVRRYWMFSPDASIQQTVRIQKFKVKHENQVNDVMLGLKEYTDMDYSLWILKAIVEQMEEKEVLIPFIETLYGIMDLDKLRARGDFDKILLMLQMYGTLNYRQLPFYRVGEKVVYVLTPEKAIEALRFARQSLIYMARDTEARVYDFIGWLKELELHAATTDKSADVLTVKLQLKIGKKMGGKSRRTVLRYISMLDEMGFVERIKGSKDEFEIVEEPESMELMLSGYKNLDNPKLVKELMEEMRKEGTAFFADRSLGVKLESTNAKIFTTDEDIDDESD